MLVAEYSMLQSLDTSVQRLLSTLCIDQEEKVEVQQDSMLGDIYMSAGMAFSFFETDAYIPTPLRTLQTMSIEARKAGDDMEKLGNMGWLQRQPQLHAEDL